MDDDKKIEEKSEIKGDDLPSEADARSDGKSETIESVIPEDILESLPEPVRKMVSTQLTVGLQGRMPNPLAAKITPEHIDKIIECDDKESDRHHELITGERRYNMAYTVLAIIAFFVLYLVVGRDDPALFKEVIIYFATFGAGFLGGWGFKSLR